jgi:AraC family transcriptional regulator
VLKADAPIGGIWIPLRGRLQVNAGAEALLQTGEVRVTEADSCLHTVGRGNAVWIALLGIHAVWKRVLRKHVGLPSLEAVLLPARYSAARELRRAAVILARTMLAGDSEAAAEVIIDRVVTLQAGLAESIARCPGRTYVQRRQVLIRLQRVRNYLEANCHLDIDNRTLARMANFSSWHFIRAFRATYEETPHAFLVSQRLERARRLLRGSSPLAIAEIAMESGFENRSAFSRLFRERFGKTPGDLRRKDSGRSMSR